ncbi:RNA-directed RNA polymerase [Teratosphaeria destructans]|uniref:RNA-dependent RNA polymerase n=1 Tax=Teratosphaeria destructans TaxID=418781 RepID=A0A9W7W2I1_9PEZI|nr:RNA-directed RNA polymerase [Teratosphaeria destructans]
MIIYKDVITGDELISDSYDLKEIDGVIYEADCKKISVGGETFDTGANASAEEAEEGADDQAQQTYMKKVKEAIKARGGSEEEVAEFEKGASSYAKKIVGNFKDYEFLIGESMDPDGMVILLNYRRSDVVPTFLRFSSLLNIRLPISTSEPGNASPTKRSGTAGHDILNKIQYLFFQERGTLDKVLLELQACRPPVTQQPDPLRTVLDKLTDAAREVKTRKTPKTAGRSIDVYATHPDGMARRGEQEPPASPTLQVKHNTCARQKGGMLPPPKQPAVRFQNGLPTPNTSFTSTTMNRSFTSDGPMTTSSASKLQLSQASTAPTSSCPDDETGSQATEYTFSSIASEQAAELEETAMRHADGGIRSFAPVTKLQRGPPSGVEPAQEGNASPSKRQHYLVAGIPQDGLTPFDLPPFCAFLPLHLQAAAYSVMRNAKLSTDQLSKAWRSPRSFTTLSDVAQQYGASTRPQDWLPGYSSATFAGKWEISKTKEGPLLDLTLHPPRREPSCSLQRKFGSDRFFIVDIPDTSESRLPGHLKGQSGNIADRIREVLAVDHTFLGRRWAQLLIQRKRSKRAAENQLDLAESGTSQVWFFAISGPKLAEVSVAEVLDWAVPFALNSDQPACKAWARLDLAASRTTPTVVFKQQQIMYGVEDQLSDDLPDDTTCNDPSFRWARGAVQQMLGLDYLPSAVQARILGAKGMWYISSGNPADGLSPDDVWIKIAKSQIKAKHAISNVADDQELLTLNVVNWSRKARSSILYPGFLPILRDRGVAADVILDMAARQVDFDTQRFINALSTPADLHEWIFAQKSLVSMRKHNCKIQMNTIAGFPSPSDERAVLMLESGFEPSSNSYLRKEVLDIARFVFSLQAKQFKVRLPASTSVYGICDPTGILMPGEAYLFLSDHIQDEEKGKVWSILDGRELVSRNPSRRNSDVQKIRLVYRTELAHLRDVIVFSSHGPRPLASKLSGGDYDGDTFWVCWDDALVQPFKNAPAPWEAEQKATQLARFGIEQDKVKLRDIVGLTHSQGPQLDQAARRWIRRSTEMRMRTEWVGVVSNLHVALTYKEGTISSKLSSLLVDLHDLIIDADKQGYIYTDEAFSRWKARAGIPRGLPKPAHSKFTGRQQNVLETPGPSKPDLRDVVDRMYFTVVEPKITQALREAQLTMRDASTFDRSLCAMFDKYSSSQSVVIKREIEALKNALVPISKNLEINMHKYHSDLKHGSQGRTGRTLIWADLIEEIRDQYQEIQPSVDGEVVEQWQMEIGEEPTMWELLKASAVARLQLATRSGCQMFYIAGSELCRLKARYQPARRTIRREVYLNMKPQKRKYGDGEDLADQFEHDLDQEDDEEEFEIGASLFDGLDFEAMERREEPPQPTPSWRRKSNDTQDRPQTLPARRSLSKRQK